MYAKVFASLWDGTLGRDWPAWSVFVFMLANCRRDGTLDLTPEAIASRSGIPLDQVEAGLRVLEQPDRRSRSSTENGRRLVKLDPHRDWGWTIVNYEHYRTIVNQDDRRAKDAERKRNERQAVATQRASATVHECPRESAHAEVEVEVKACKSTPLVIADDRGAILKLRKDWSESFDQDFWPAYPRKVAKEAARASWMKLLNGHDQAEAEALFQHILDGLSWYKRGEWSDRPRDKITHASTWLNQERWKDLAHGNA